MVQLHLFCVTDCQETLKSPHLMSASNGKMMVCNEVVENEDVIASAIGELSSLEELNL